MPNTVTDTMTDPKHHRDTDAPCTWCGAKWTKSTRTPTARDMVHTESCQYLVWLDADENETLLDLIGSTAPVERSEGPRMFLTPGYVPGYPWR